MKPWWGRLALAVAFVLIAVSCSPMRQSGDGAESVGESSNTSSPPEVVVPPARGFSDEEAAAFDDALDTFLETDSVAAVRSVVDLMALSGELRFAPWLVDVVQMGLSNTLNADVIDILSTMTGLEATGQTFADFGRIGSWVDSRSIDPGPRYREWKLTLYGRVDPEFATLLDSVADDDQFARIRFGGVRRGGIPELNDPDRISASAALEWITDDEVVLGVDIEGEEVAYPFRIVSHHELVNDTVAGMPVALVYCTLCRTGLLFDRRVEGQVLDFETSGLLTNSNKIMVDVQTDTLWHHAAATGIGGELLGSRLDLFPVETTTWAEWYAEHPRTEVLAIPEPIFFEDPERPPIAYPYEASGAYAAYYDNPEVWFPVRETSDVFDQKTEVIGITGDGAELAVLVSELEPGRNRYFQVGTLGVVIVPNSRGARVYGVDSGSPAGGGLVSGEIVEVVSSDTDVAVLADGTQAFRIVVEQGFWFSWSDRHPDTEIWPIR